METRKATPGAPARGRLRQIAVTATAVTIGLGLLALLAVWLFLASLDTVPVRTWLSGQIRQATGLNVSWESARISTRGKVHLSGVRVANAPPWAVHVEDLVSIADAQIDVAPTALLAGRIRVSRLALRDVRASWVRGPQGSNLDMFATGDAPAIRDRPWSITGPQGMDVRIERMSVEDLSLAVVDIAQDGAVSLIDLSSIAASGDLSLAPDGAIGGRLALLGPEGGVPLRFLPAAPGATAAGGHILLDAGIRVIDGTATTHVRLGVVDQSLSDRLPSAFGAIVLDATAANDPAGLRIDISALDLLDGAVTGRLAARVGATDGTAHVREGTIQIDIPALPEPLLAMLPIRLDGPGQLDLAIRELGIRPSSPFVQPGGSVTLAGDLGHLVMVAGPRTLTLEAVHPDLVLSPGPDATAVLSGAVQTNRITLTNGLTPEVDIVDATVGLEGTLRANEASDVALVLAARAFDAQAPSARIALRDVALRIAVPLDGALPRRGEATLTIGPSQALLGQRAMPIPASRLDATLDDVVIDGDSPARSTGTVALSGRVGSWAMDAGAVKDPEGADVRLVLSTPSLALLQPLMAPVARAVDWHQAGANVRIAGRLGLPNTGKKSQEQAVHADLSFDVSATNVHVRQHGHGFRFPATHMDGTIRIGPAPLDVRATLAIDRPTVDGRNAPFGLAGNVAVDLSTSRPSLSARLRTTGSADPMHTDLDLQWMSGDKSLRWTVDAVLRDPGPFARLFADMPAGLTDLTNARLDLKSTGRLTGVVRHMDGAMPILYRDAVERARGSAALEALVTTGGDGPTVQDGTIRVDIDADTDTRQLRAHLDFPSAEMPSGTGRFRVADLTADVQLAATGMPDRGRVEVEGTLAIGSVTQNDADLAWPIGDLSLSIGGRLDRLASLRIDRMTLDNSRSGTHLEALAAVDLPEVPGGRRALAAEGIDRIVGRQAIAVEGTVVQDLARIAAPPETFAGTGTVRIPFRLESGDWTVYRVDAMVTSTNVSIRMPGLPLEIDGLNGHTPITEAIAVAPDGTISLVKGDGSDAWARVLFADQHPFLAGSTDVSMRRLTTGPLTLGPVAGNLRITGNSLRLDQMEAAWRGGRATGQLILDLVPGDIGVGFRGNVTGIRAGGSDEMLDANAALTASLGRMDVEGRIHLNRVGRDHVKDLLDAVDPWSENAAINRIRKLLTWGYPKSVQVEVRHNTLAATVSLGGIASVVRIDPIRGVPVAPLLRRYVGPMIPVGGKP